MPNFPALSSSFFRSFFAARSPIVMWMDRIVEACGLIAVALLPLVVVPLTNDPAELHQQGVLVVLAALALLATSIRMWVTEELRVPITLPLIGMKLVLFAVILATYTSEDWRSSFFGALGNTTWSLISVLMATILLATLSQLAATRERTERFWLAGAVAAFFSSVFGIVRLLGWVGNAGFDGGLPLLTTVGSYNALGMFVAPLSALMLYGIWRKEEFLTKFYTRIAFVVAFVASFLYLLMLDYWPATMGFLILSVLLGVYVFFRGPRTWAWRHLLPLGAFVAALLLLVVRAPFPVSVPTEVSPSVSVSWSLAQRVLSDHPWLGSGPNTWVYAYARYRAAATNLTPFWNVRFDRAPSTILTLAVTTGVLGMIAWFFLFGLTIAQSIFGMYGKNRYDMETNVVFGALATTIFVESVVYHMPLASFVLLAIVLAYLGRERAVWVWTKGLNTKLLRVACALVCVAVLVLNVTAVSAAARRVWAEIPLAQGVSDARAGQLDRAILKLQMATSRASWSDASFRNLSQAYVLRLVEEAKRPNGAERSKKMNELTGKAIEAAKRATELNQANVDNWSNFALVLETIAPFARGADEQAIAMYKKALEREPVNAMDWFEIGRLYLNRADGYRQLVQSKDEAVRKEAERHMKEENENAAEAFNQALQMKPDLAVAHYNLGLVYERQGRVVDAIAKVESALASRPTDAGIAFQLALLYYRNGDTVKAEKLLEQIVAVDPTYANAHWYLSYFYEADGRYQDALDQVNRVLATNPESTVARSRVSDLLAKRDKTMKPKLNLPEPLPELNDTTLSPTEATSTPAVKTKKR